MITFVLVLTMFHLPGVGSMVAIPGFASNEDCQRAGQSWKQGMSSILWPNFICLEQTTVRP